MGELPSLLGRNEPAAEVKPLAAPNIEEPKPAVDDAEDKKIEESKEETKTEEPKPDMKKVRFIHPMPSFVWKDMKVYGPYDEGEEVEIFPEVAELLVRKGRAEIV